MSFYTSSLVDLTNSLSKFLQIDLNPSDNFQAKPTKSSHPNSPIQSSKYPQRKKSNTWKVHGHLPYVLRLKKNNGASSQLGGRNGTMSTSRHKPGTQKSIQNGEHLEKTNQRQMTWHFQKKKRVFFLI